MSKAASPIHRTFHPKYTIYTGDGNGRDHYILFNNGGLSQLRDYRGSMCSSFNLSPHLLANSSSVTAKKEPAVFDYVPDGTGRDLYVIRANGLKRNYRSQLRAFETNLRTMV